VEIATLPAVALQRGSRVSFFASVARSTGLCLKAFRRRRPASLLAMGGFTSAGPVLAARVLGVPVFLHESNTVPGRANRLLARFASGVLVGFPSAARGLGRRVVVVGTPVRSQFCAAEPAACRRRLGLDPDRPVVLVVGGSQGARGINETVLRALPGARSMLSHWQWLHLAGPADEVRVRAAYAAAGLDAVVHGFWDRMEGALGAASAAVTRAGASSLAEFAAMQVPAVLVPFPHAAGNHQFHNACAFESTGAAVLIEEADLQPEHLLAALRPLVEDPGVRTRMQGALAAWHAPQAATRMAECLLRQSLQPLADNTSAPGDTEVLPQNRALVA
jgi:UDP-N-acetylglucosamine--N-acetylmuramyl-(pentapeptide) pyrophosphoryl-undecaprenol N-acetylglucosamine transferase